jgi:predicted protein tyrosine phosphatase
MEQENNNSGCKFKIVDFNMDILDHVDADGTVHLKKEYMAHIAMVTNIPIQEVLLPKKNVENHMRDMFVSLVNDKKMKNLLFVCEGNEQRSPSFETWFKEHRSKYNVRSAGTNSVYFEQINKETLEWADRVFLMDLEQERFISRKFPQFVDKTEIIGCSDQYARGDPQLVKVIEYWVRKRGL